jgi:hypothetical protein
MDVADERHDRCRSLAIWPEGKPTNQKGDAWDNHV